MFSTLPGEGWLQIGELTLAFILSFLIGLERQIRNKSAGLRTYTLVGMSAALIMLVSKYGFMDVLGPNVTLDPSRVAAQIVTGIGFLGGGLIFVKRDSVRGLTTAAIIWLTAAIGMACGSGLYLLAIAVTICHFMVTLGFPLLEHRLPRSRWSPSLLQVNYPDNSKVLNELLLLCTRAGFSINQLQLERIPPTAPDQPKTTTAIMQIQGKGNLSELVAQLVEIDGVLSVSADDVDMLTG